MASMMTTALMLSLFLNLFIVVTVENLDTGFNIISEDKPLQAYVDYSNPNNPTIDEQTPVDITPEGSIVTSTGFGFVDWLKNIWEFVQNVFRFIFAVSLLMRDLGMPSFLVTLIGIPIGIMQLIGTFLFIRGVSG